MQWSWSPEVERVLRTAGWFPGRSVDTTRWRERFAGSTPMHAAAAGFLNEFGGLFVNIKGSGITRARTPFELDPQLAHGEEDRFEDLGGEIGHSLFPLGELDHGRFFLGIDENGEIYLLGDRDASFGRMPGAMENLILGIRPEDVP